MQHFRSKPTLRFIRLAVSLCAFLALAVPAFTQEEMLPASAVRTANSGWSPTLTNWRYSVDLPLRYNLSLPDYHRDFARPSDSSLLLPKPVSLSSPDAIEKMEAAFSCNDTPFIDQVRLPVAALWHGRVRLTGFESDVTTANFVLGLPGAGTLSSLSLTGSGHLATRTPPSDQLVGMHVTFSFGNQTTDSVDNSGLHGLEHLARSGRNFLQTLIR